MIRRWRWRPNLSILRIKQGRIFPPLSTHNQFRAKLIADTDAEQPVTNAALRQEHGTQNPAHLLPNSGRWKRRMEPDLVKSTNIQQRFQIRTGKPIFVPQRYVVMRICRGALHIRRSQEQYAFPLEGVIQSIHNPKKRMFGDMLNHVRHVNKGVPLWLVCKKIADTGFDIVKNDSVLAK